MSKRFFGLGQETTVGTSSAREVFFPFMADTQEQCVLCGYIDDRNRMHFAGFTDGGETNCYVCGRPDIPA